MAGRNPAAAQTALLSIFWIWESFISEKYMKEAYHNYAVPCPTCNSPRTCKNHFCLQCKTGGLCPAVFRGDNEHRDHPWLQVRQCSRKDSVLSEDLAHFMSNEGLKHIHTNKLNEKERHCYLKSKQVAEPSSSSRHTPAKVGGEKVNCAGCMGSIQGSDLSVEPFLVCSLQCLLKVARIRPALNLLAMNDGAMDPMEPPLLYREKLSEGRHTSKTPTKSRRKPKTPTKTPVDEAPSSSQATGDSPLLNTHETPREEPVVEAPPLPPATGDFPMFETHEDLEVEAILAALPFPLEIDNYPMFGTPAEASFGEALPFPPATEDSPMSERPEAPPAAPADPADTIKLNAFSLPPEFQALDFGPEWAEKMWTRA